MNKFIAIFFLIFSDISYAAGESFTVNLIATINNGPAMENVEWRIIRHDGSEHITEYREFEYNIENINNNIENYLKINDIAIQLANREDTSKKTIFDLISYFNEMVDKSGGERIDLTSLRKYIDKEDASSKDIAINNTTNDEKTKSREPEKDKEMLISELSKIAITESFSAGSSIVKRAKKNSININVPPGLYKVVAKLNSDKEIIRSRSFQVRNNVKVIVPMD